MDYSYFVNALRSASLFDLFRLRAAIDRLLDDPARIAQVKARLSPGMQITFFDTTTNRLEEATVLEVRRTQLLVQMKSDSKRWLIQIYTVNVEHVATDLHPVSQQGGMDPSQVKVGDSVGFTARDGRPHFGSVIRLNQKTATIRTTDGHRWRVAYEYLSPVIQGEVASERLELDSATFVLNATEAD